MFNRIFFQKKLAFFIVFTMIGSCSKKNEQLIAKVGDEKISLSIFQDRYKEFLTKQLQEDNLMNRYVYLNSLIDEKLILQYAVDNNIESEPLYLKKGKEVYDQLLLNLYFDQKINLDYSVSDEEARDLFKWGKTSIHVRHLFAKDIEQITDLKHRLDNGENWRSLAGECFQDSTLKNNGGNLGWYKLGELDPNFEFNAFSLNPNEISEPVKTQDGYSIIHLIESEFDGMITEDEYQSRKKKLIQLAKKYKQKARLIEFTDDAILAMNIEYDKKVLNDLFYFLFSTSKNIPEKFQNDKLVAFNGSEWNVGHALEKLGELSENQLSKISTLLDLKQALTGLICRSKFLEDAQRNKIHESDQFQQEYKSHQNQTMISIVMKGLSAGSSSDTVLSHQKIRENYFIFRNELTLGSEITVDSLMVKTFIM
jgi:foldase protein PrsA|tara:strand:+ start:1383 stop:2654 length:1272 start_codon:yes stop_codon:yes gene_type:complete